MDRRTFVKVAAGSVAAGALIAVAGPASIALAYNWPRSLRRGMEGADVLELQVRIAGWASDSPNNAGFALDGSYGPGTEAAVRRFQRAYGLEVDGKAGPATQRVLNSLEGPNGTRNFAWSEFTAKRCSAHAGTFGGGVYAAGTARENVRRMMYQLEAVRVKVGNQPININSGFRCREHNQAVGGDANSRHMYGRASDIRLVPGLHRAVQSSGFTNSYEDGYVHGSVL